MEEYTTAIKMVAMMITKIYENKKLDEDDKENLKMLQQISIALTKLVPLQKKGKVLNSSILKEDKKIIEEFLARNKNKKLK